LRHIIYGAGAIGGTIGGHLAEAGWDVVLIARGAHFNALRENGLTLHTPNDTLTSRLTVTDSIADADPQDGDVVYLAMKSQDTRGAVEQLDAAASGRYVPVVCAQNGVQNESAALRRGFPTYGMSVLVAATHLEPGVVYVHTAPISGVLELGRYPAGIDDRAVAIAATLRGATFDVNTDDDIMAWKYTKLLDNIGNTLDAACGWAARKSPLLGRAIAEAVACYDAAGIGYIDSDRYQARRDALPAVQAAGGLDFQGSSSWQGLARNTGHIEADWLNGEIVLLGRLLDMKTPVNDVLRRLAHRLVRERLPPGSVAITDVEAEVLAMDG
jgi:2-dehydropantoate 2-reductase